MNGWLRGIGLEQYAQTFRDNAIDVDVLCDLTDEHRYTHSEARAVFDAFMSAGAGARSNTYNHHGRRPTAETWCGFFLRRGAGLLTCHFLFYRLFSFLECHADKASSGSLEAEQDEAQMPQ